MAEASELLNDVAVQPFVIELIEVLKPRSWNGHCRFNSLAAGSFGCTLVIAGVTRGLPASSIPGQNVRGYRAITKIRKNDSLVL